MAIDNCQGGHWLQSWAFRWVSGDFSFLCELEATAPELKEGIWFYDNTNIRGQMGRPGYPEAALNYTANVLIGPLEGHLPLFDQYMQFVHQTRERVIIMWFQPIKVLQATQEGRVSTRQFSTDEEGFNEEEMCSAGVIWLIFHKVY